MTRYYRGYISYYSSKQGTNRQTNNSYKTLTIKL